MRVAQERTYTDLEQSIMNAIKQKGDSAVVKIYNSNKKNAPSCCEFYPEDGKPLDPVEIIEEIAEYIEQEADNYPMFLIAVKKDRKDGGKKFTAMGRKQSLKVSSNNNNNSSKMGGNELNLVGLLLNERKESTSEYNSLQNDVRKLTLTIAESTIRNEVRKEANREISHYQSIADAAEKKRKKAKKKRKKNKGKSVFSNLLNSKEAKDIGMRLVDRFLEPESEADIIPIDRVERQQYQQRVDVAGTPENTQKRVIETENTDDSDDLEGLNTSEEEALKGYDYLVKNNVADAGLIIHAAARLMVKEKGNWAFSQLMKKINKEKVLILREKSAK